MTNLQYQILNQDVFTTQGELEACVESIVDQEIMYYDFRAKVETIFKYVELKHLSFGIKAVYIVKLRDKKDWVHFDNQEYIYANDRSFIHSYQLANNITE